jgi:hypothetical protein
MDFSSHDMLTNSNWSEQMVGGSPWLEQEEDNYSPWDTHSHWDTIRKRLRKLR